MVQRSRIAPEPEARWLRERGGQAPVRPHQIAIRNLAALALLAALACSLPAFLRPGFFEDQARGLVAFAVAAGDWTRTALAAAFNSIPTR